MRRKVITFVILVVGFFLLGKLAGFASAQQPVVTIVCESVHTFVSEQTGKPYQKCKTPEGEILPLVEGEVERLSPSKAVLSIEPSQVDNTVFVKLAVGVFFMLIILAIVAYSLSRVEPQQR